MKYFLWLFIFNCSLLIAQENVHFGIKAGLNKCQVLGDKRKGYYKNGINGGLFSQLKLSKKSSAQFEILFSEKGGHYKHTKDKDKPVSYYQYYIRLYYLEFPILLQFHHKKFDYEIGAGVGYRIDQKENDDGELAILINPFTKFEKSMYMGVGYNINDKWGVNVRYNNSIVPIRRVPSVQYNSVFSLSLCYKTAFRNKKS